MTFQTFIVILILFFSFSSSAAYQTETLVLKNSKLHMTHWTSSTKNVSNNNKLRETIILLSGPTDNWNSDSAWFARLAPKLSDAYNVTSIDRAGQIFADRNAALGYISFGENLFDALIQLKLKKVKFISFASSNISLLKFFQLNMNLPIDSRIIVSQIVLIDPDVLLPYSIKRYTEDAKPFKDNLANYTNYVLQGKYQERAKQKNQSELAHLKSLAKEDPATNWPYVDIIFEKRLKTNNIVNLFAEIALYGEDLNAAAKLSFPKAIPLVIYDTNFEQIYIDNTTNEKEKLALSQWQTQAKEYYQSLTKKSVSGQYISLDTTEHLLPFSQPELIIKSLVEKPINN